MSSYRADGCGDKPSDFCAENGISQHCSYGSVDDCGRSICQLDSYMWLDPCLPSDELANYRANGCFAMGDFCARYNGGDCLSYDRDSCGRYLCYGDNHHPDLLDWPCPEDPCDEFDQNDMDDYSANGCTGIPSSFCNCKFGVPGRGSYCKDYDENLDSCGRAVCQDDYGSLEPCSCEEEYDQNKMDDYLQHGCTTPTKSGTDPDDDFCNCLFGPGSHCKDDVADGRDECNRTVCQWSNHVDLLPCPPGTGTNVPGDGPKPDGTLSFSDEP